MKSNFKNLSIAIVCLVIACTTGIVLRSQNLNESLWLDELHTAWSVAGELSTVLERAELGNQSPLFFWAEWCVVRCFGMSEISLRILPLACGILTIVSGGWIAWRFTRSFVALFSTAALLAIDLDLIYFSQEARPYSMVALLSLWQIYLFIKLMKFKVDESDEHRTDSQKHDSKSSLNSVTFCFLSIALFYTHYTSAILFVPELIITLVAFSKQRWLGQSHLKITTLGWILIAIGVLAVLPAISHLIEVHSKKTDWEIVVKAWPVPPRLTRVLLLGTIPASAMILIWTLGRGLRADKTDWPLEKALLIAVLIALFLIPFASVWATSQYEFASLFLVRYFIGPFTVAILGAGMSVAMFKSKWIRGVCSILLITGAIWATIEFKREFVVLSLRQHSVASMHGEDWKNAVKRLNQFATDDRVPVFLISALIEDHRLNEESTIAFYEYLKFPVTGIYKLDDKAFDVIPRSSWSDGRFDKDDIDRIAKTKSCWLLIRGIGRGPQAVATDLAKSAQKSKLALSSVNREQFGGLTVVKMNFNNDKAK